MKWNEGWSISPSSWERLYSISISYKTIASTNSCRNFSLSLLHIMKWDWECPEMGEAEGNNWRYSKATWHGVRKNRCFWIMLFMEYELWLLAEESIVKFDRSLDSLDKLSQTQSLSVNRKKEFVFVKQQALQHFILRVDQCLPNILPVCRDEKPNSRFSRLQHIPMALTFLKQAHACIFWFLMRKSEVCIAVFY